MPRPAKPMLGPVDPLEQAMWELAEGAIDINGAAEFCSLSRDEIERAMQRGELEGFHHGRKWLLVKRHVQAWLAKKLLAERERRGVSARTSEHEHTESRPGRENAAC